nr:hypothetical protein [Comamonas jiangduensis]
MRRFLPLFMMLLLTLRGLLGDAMAMGSMPNVPPHQPAATTVALDMPAHAAHHAAQAADTGGSLHDTSTEHGSTHCATTTDSAPPAVATTTAPPVRRAASAIPCFPHRPY